VGKTRLALAVAAASREAFPDGVRWVDLAALADPNLVPHTVAAALSVRETVGQSMLAMLVRALCTRRLLLALDNCEHLVEACARLVDRVLQGCPDLQALLTSREPLRIAGETTWRVPSLAVPDPDLDLSPEAALQYEAVRLFAERAIAVRPAFAVTAQNVGAVAAVCRRLDGIPLALELAAGRLAVLTVEQIAARLDDRFGLLTNGSRAALPRHQTLRATIDWSYDLLGQLERSLLRRLAIFAGGWTLEAAEAACAGEDEGPTTEDDSPSSTGIRPSPSGLRARDVLGVLARLVEKSLVLAEPDAHGATRYRLLESVRQYAEEKLMQAGDEHEVACRRHADWCLDLAEQANAGLSGPDAGVWLNRLEVEHENLRAALAWSIDRAPDDAVHLAGRLRRFWVVRYHVAEGVYWLRRCLAHLPEPTAQRAWALLHAGVLAKMRSDLDSVDSGRAWLEESLSLGRRLGERPLVAKNLPELGSLWFWLGDYLRARALLEEAVALARATGSPLDLGSALDALGWLSFWEGAYQAGWDELQEGLTTLRAAGEPLGSIIPCIRLARLAVTRGDPVQAHALAAEALATAEATRGPRHLASVQQHLGAIHRWLGELDQAAAHYTSGSMLAREVSDPLALAFNLVGLGAVTSLQGDAAGARTLLEECLELCAAMGCPSGRAMALHALGLAAWRDGDPAGAAARLRASLALRQELGEPLSVAECLEGLALVAAHDRPAWAARLLGAAESIRQRIGAPRPPVDQPALAAAVAATRAALGKRAFATAWAAGGALPERTVGEALAQPDASPPAAAAAPVTPPAGGLSRRETEVLRLVAGGLSNQEIAGDLALSVRTVERHITNLYGKIGARGRADATAFAFRHHLAHGR
jgi:non-specific serine/threonine protein kinase